MISLYFHTLKYLKLKQIYGRILFNISKPQINKEPVLSLMALKNNFCLPIAHKKSLRGNYVFCFLNKCGSLSKIGWQNDNNNYSKLWRYNQHYFDDLTSKDSFKRKKKHINLLMRWVKENPVGVGVGWDSYPTSLRIVNWIKWSLSKNILTRTLLNNLVIQVRWLNKRLEWHILGNHLLSNAKALVFAGIFFSGEEANIWLSKGLKILENELTEQILSDGGNFERSPMYHSIVLEDLLDLINISRTSNKNILRKHENRWIKIAIKMFRWLEAMNHPDGKISFFNDSALGIAPSLNDLRLYASRLNINFKFSKFNKIINLFDTGYIRMTSKDAVVLLDTAPIGPDYLPGHAHADTLSFELSLFGQRLFVNSGTSDYGNNPTRQYERSTKAHNTVVVNNRNSSEVWGSFRVARRANPINLIIKKLKNETIVSCSHDGYKHLIGKPVHKRIWKLSNSSLIIKDYIKGSFRDAFAYFYLHPSIKIKESGKNNWKLKIKNFPLISLNVKCVSSKLEQSYYSPEFGKKIKSQRLKLEIDNQGSYFIISWRN